MSYFIDMCLWDNMIFKGWLPWLASKIGNWSYKKEIEAIPFDKEHSKYEEAFMQVVRDNFLFKILGGCLYCANVWHSMVVFNIAFWITWCNGLVNGWYYFGILPFIFFSSFIVRKISKND